MNPRPPLSSFLSMKPEALSFGFGTQNPNTNTGINTYQNNNSSYNSQINHSQLNYSQLNHSQLNHNTNNINNTYYISQNINVTIQQTNNHNPDPYNNYNRYR